MNKEDNNKKIIEIEVHSESKKKTYVIEVINIILVMVSLFCSIYSIYNSVKISKYQVNQERLPKVVFLNQTMDVNFKRSSDKNISDFSPIDDMLLSVYNIGVGVAQNCEIQWNIASIKDACIETKNLLDYNVSVHEFEYDELQNQQLHLYDYSFQLSDDILDAVWYYDMELQKYRISDFNIDLIKYSYILPITTQTTEVYVKIPDCISALLLELGNQEITTPISAQLDISYQDMAGQNYSNKYIISFNIDEVTEENNMLCCTYNIDACTVK